MRELIERLESISEEQLGLGSVGHFLMILRSKLIQADKRQEQSDIKRGIPVNIYRLGHWIGGSNNVAKAVKGREGSTEKADLLKLKAAMIREFTPDFSPVRYVAKGIDTVLKGGKPPKITGKGGAALTWK